MELFGLLIVLFLVASLILPWVNLGRLNGQRKELEALRCQLRELEVEKAGAKLKHGVAAKAEDSRPKQSAGPPPLADGFKTASSQSAPVETSMETVGQIRRSGDVRALRSPTEFATHATADAGAEAEFGDPGSEASGPGAERQDWFSKLAVWVGGVALLMAGFYMIKYSMDSGWLTPMVRIWLTTGFGALLCGAGFVIGIRSTRVANERIGQALAGAGIACLYFAAYAAVHLYGFLTPTHGFLTMLAVTVLAVGLSLKNGAPIAMMGLVGGFLTPWLMSSGSDDTALLFSYLFLLFCGAQFICVRRGWWPLLLGSLVGAYLWSTAVIVGNLSGVLGNLEGTLLFVLGLCAVNGIWACMTSPEKMDASAQRWLTGLRMITWGGGLVQGLVLVSIGGFAAVDMGLFSLLSVGALILAVLKEREFIWAACLALVAVGMSVLANTDTAVWSWLIAPLGLMGLFFGVGHWRGLSGERTLVWRAISVGAAVSVVPLLYLNRECIGGAGFSGPAVLWLGLSVFGACLLAAAGEQLLRRSGDRLVAGEYGVFSLSAFSFGLWTYLPDAYMAHAAAILLAGAALYWKRRQFGRSELITGLLGLAWATLMWRHALDAVAYFARGEFYGWPKQDGMAVVAWLLGLAAAGTVTICFRRDWAGQPRSVLNWLPGLVGLLGFVALYQWLDERYMPTEWAGTAVEGGLTTALAFAAAGAVFGVGQWRSLRYVSVILAGLVGFRIAFLHLGDTGAAGERFFFNALALQFGVPFLVAVWLAWQSGRQADASLRRAYQIGAMLLGFVWATFLVQDYYGGSGLLDRNNSIAEIYTYSVVWLLLAVGYQVIGLWRRQAVLHVGSLVLLLLTVGKVFLVDASELEGLFRVLSFLGLGLVLIGIGFFYNKVVFARRGEEGHADS
jgi:uncharacterized membrane protein